MKKRTRNFTTNRKKNTAKLAEKHKSRLQDFLYDDEYYAEDEVYEGEDEYYAEEESYAEEDGYYAEEESYADDDEYYAEEESYADDDEYYAEEESYAEEDGYYVEEEAYAGEDGYYAEDGVYTDETEYDAATYDSGENEEEYVISSENQEYIYEEQYADDENSEDDFYEYAEYDNEEEYEAEDEDSFETEYVREAGQDRESNVKQSGYFMEYARDFISQMTGLDWALTVMTVLVLVVAVITFSSLFTSHRVDDQIEALAPIGTQLSEIGVAGESGLLAMADAKLQAQMIADEITEEEPTESQEEVENITVSVSFESVEKDLKIRFRNANTGSYITGTAFEVTLTGVNYGKKVVLTDSDMDGIIYASNLDAGNYNAVITSTDKYKFPETARQVTVKKKVEYVVINVEDEVKKESQVNVAVEDTAKVEAVTEEVKLTDTVEWVESSRTVVDGSDGYQQIEKNTINDPALSASALGRMMRFDNLKVEFDKNTMTLQVGGNDTLSPTSFEDSKTEEEEITYKKEWTSSNTDVATVENGKVSAKTAGTATITYTVTKTTKKTIKEKGADTTKEETTTRTISAEEYEKLSEEEKSHCEENKDADGNLIDYTLTETTTETGSATCDVTVEAVKIASATLELAKTADNCNIGDTVTVSPAKLVYTKTDNTTETITSNFPTVAWTSSDSAIATVDEKGVVKGVKAGTVTITGQIKGVTGKDGKELEIKATTNIVINQAAALTLSLDKTEASLAVGKTLTLTPTVKNYKSDKNVTWVSADTKIATVDGNGVVTALAVGTVKITATTVEKDITSQNMVSAVCTITVTNSASADKTSRLKDKNGNQVYVKDANGNFVEAVFADYYTASAFFLKKTAQYTYTGWQTIDGKTYYFDKNGKPVTGKQIIQGVTYNFDNTGAIQTSVNGATFGIDVSKWNGKIDWNAVKSSGVDYVIIRCGYRGSSSGALIEDSLFKSNIQGATAAGLKVGIYFFSQAVNEVEAVQEASYAVQLAKSYHLTYPIFIDTEPSGGRADKLDRNTRTAVVNAFCQTVTNSGYQAGIYASKSWLESKLNTSSLNQYKIWLAQYSAAPTYNGKYDMWQYSHKGTISGINGNVDLNLSYMGK